MGVVQRKDETVRGETALDALGSPVRREIVKLLSERPQNVAEIASNFTVSRPAISKHLKLLETAGLVSHTTRGNSNFYELSETGFETAHAWLDRFWIDALARFRLVAENTKPEEPDA